MGVRRVVTVKIINIAIIVTTSFPVFLDKQTQGDQVDIINMVVMVMVMVVVTYQGLLRVYVYTAQSIKRGSVSYQRISLYLSATAIKQHQEQR